MDSEDALMKFNKCVERAKLNKRPFIASSLKVEQVPKGFQIMQSDILNGLIIKKLDEHYNVVDDDVLIKKKKI